jgi:hypothetical protein
MREIIAHIERARSEGVDISANMYPYETTASGLAANVPGWAQAGGMDAMLARFHDAAQRTRSKPELWQGQAGMQKVPDDILLISPLAKSRAGRSVEWPRTGACRMRVRTRAAIPNVPGWLSSNPRSFRFSIRSSRAGNASSRRGVISS